jgi:tyrosine-protein kinase Etk/Wzc
LGTPAPTFNEWNFDFNNIISEFKKRKLIFIGFAILVLSLAFLFLKYIPRKYDISSILLIRTDDNTNYDPNALIKNFGGSSLDKNYRNEILVLQSTPLLLKVIDRLDVNVTYYRIDNYFFKQLLYKSNPFVVLLDKSVPQPLKLEISIKLLSPDMFKLSLSGKKIQMYNFGSKKDAGVIDKIKFKGQYAFGEKIQTEYFSFTILKQNVEEIEKNIGRKYQVVFNHNYNLISNFKQNLKVQMTDNQSSAVNITFKDPSVLRGIEFLNNLVAEYLNFNIEKKNLIAENTISYIDEQVSQIEDSLSFTEQRLQDYRTSRNIISTETKANKIYDQLLILENQKAQLVVQQQYYSYIKQYFEQNKDISEIIAPSSTNIEDNLLTNMIQELTSLNAEINALDKNNQQKSPYYKSLNDKISNLKNTIYENIKYLNNTSSIAIDNITSRINKINYEINQLPKTERELVSIERKFKLNDAIYTFLLQKRAESEITKASNLPNTEIIEPPSYAGIDFPNAKLIYLVALFLVFAVPVIYLIILNLINDQITNYEVLESMTTYPLVGKIYNAGPHTRSLLDPNKKNEYIERFKSIRTNLDYFMSEGKNQLIMITSASGSDGKSFVAWNLGNVLAQNGKRTLILNFDLRKPFAIEQIDIKNEKGISHFLINRASFDDLIQPTRFENLFFIAPGDLPPNPSELISSKKTRELLDLVCQKFDIILVDTPPLGMFTDAELLIKMAHFVLFVVRENQTGSKNLRIIFKDLENKKISNLGIIYNSSSPITREKYYYYEKASKVKSNPVMSIPNNKPQK